MSRQQVSRDLVMFHALPCLNLPHRLDPVEIDIH